MSGRPVTLAELLRSRDARSQRQKELLAAYETAALISFTVNYPGPVKANGDALFLHREGARAIGRRLLCAPVPHCALFERDTGPEGFWLVEMDPLPLKRICCELEGDHPLGRLFDIDVLGRDGAPVGRTALGYPARGCLLCGGDPAHCRREGRHTIEALTERIREMAADYRARRREPGGPA